MKNFIKISFVVILLLSTGLAFSNDFVVLTKENSTSVLFASYKDVEKNSVMQIKDQSGFVLYNEIIMESGDWNKTFDLNQLPDADYCFELTKSNEIIIQPFGIKNNEIVFNKKEEIIISKPKIQLKNDFVYLTADSTSMKPIRIDVYFESGELAYSENIDSKLSRNRVYDFSDSKKGQYTIVATLDNRIFKEKIQVGSW